MNPLSLLVDRLPRTNAPTRSAEALWSASERRAKLEALGRSNTLLAGLQDSLAQRLERSGELDEFRSAWQASLACGRPCESEALAGRTTERQDLNPGERTLKAAAWARAASEVLHEMSLEHPAMLQQVHRVDGALRVVPPRDGEAPPVVIVERSRAWLMPTPAGRPVAELGSEFGAALATGRFHQLTERAPQLFPSPIAVVLDRRSLQVARAGWRRGGLTGPWLVMGSSSRSNHGPPMELVGGALVGGRPALFAEIAARLFRRVDELLAAVPDGTYQWLGRDLTRRYIDAWRTLEHGERAQPDGPRQELTSVRVSGSGSTARLAEAVQAALGELGEQAPVLALEGRNAVLAPAPGPGFEERFAAALAEERQGQGIVEQALRPVVGQATSAAARTLLLRSLKHPLSLVEGPLGWLDRSVRVAWSQDVGTPEMHLAIAPAIGAPPGPDGLSVAGLADGDGVRLGILASGRFASGDWGPRFAERIGRHLG